MTEIHAQPIPTSHVEDAAEHPALQSLDYAQLQKLRKTSRSIRALGFLWGISGLAGAYLGAMMVSAQGEDASRGTLLMAYGLVVAVVGPYSAWARPDWGRWVCMVLSIPPLLQPLHGTLLGILSLIALASAEPLFGSNKVSHHEVDAAFKARGG
jgi:hypothetical protein